MTDKPILFSAPMIRALLAGTKTQTRRLVKFSDLLADRKPTGEIVNYYGDHRIGMAFEGTTLVQPLPIAPGDRLWVRERFAVSGLGYGKKPKDAAGGKVHYFADPDNGWFSYWGSGHPSIHMPRWASRLTLTVTDVRVQRLQDISEADAWAEGCKPDPECADDHGNPFPAEEPHPKGGFVGWDCARDWFADLWNSIHGPDAWDQNPWVYALTFTVHCSNIDQMDT